MSPRTRDHPKAQRCSWGGACDRPFGFNTTPGEHRRRNPSPGMAGPRRLSAPRHEPPTSRIASRLSSSEGRDPVARSQTSWVHSVSTGSVPGVRLGRSSLWRNDSTGATAWAASRVIAASKSDTLTTGPPAAAPTTAPHSSAAVGQRRRNPAAWFGRTGIVATSYHPDKAGQRPA